MEGNGDMSCVKTLNKTQHIFQEIIFLHFWLKESPEWHLRCNMVKVETRAFDLHHFYSHPNVWRMHLVCAGACDVYFLPEKSPAVVKSEKNETAVT